MVDVIIIMHIEIMCLHIPNVCLHCALRGRNYKLPYEFI